MSFRGFVPNSNTYTQPSTEQSSSPPHSNTQNEIYSNNELLEQLIYVETFMPELDSNKQADDELKSFVDNSFVFMEEKKANHKSEESSEHRMNDELMVHSSNPQSFVPPVMLSEAKSSLELAGLNKEQIDILATLVAQHKEIKQQPLPLDTNIIPPGYNNNSESITHAESLHDIENGQNNAHSSSSDGTPVVPTQDMYNSENQLSTNVDKRRRNTAASARFRIKKKLKEQKLERDVKDLKDLASTLELKIKNLTMENHLLKNLIVEKNIRKSSEEVENMKKRALNSFTVNDFVKRENFE